MLTDIGEGTKIMPRSCVIEAEQGVHVVGCSFFSFSPEPLEAASPIPAVTTA